MPVGKCKFDCPWSLSLLLGLWCLCYILLGNYPKKCLSFHLNTIYIPLISKYIFPLLLKQNCPLIYNLSISFSKNTLTNKAHVICRDVSSFHQSLSHSAPCYLLLFFFAQHHHSYTQPPCCRCSPVDLAGNYKMPRLSVSLSVRPDIDDDQPNLCWLCVIDEVAVILRSGGHAASSKLICSMS